MNRTSILYLGSWNAYDPQYPHNLVLPGNWIVIAMINTDFFDFMACVARYWNWFLPGLGDSCGKNFWKLFKDRIIL